MESIDILTGQHVIIKYEPAGILRRGCALIIDYIIMFLYIYIIIYSFWGLNLFPPVSRSIQNIIIFIIFLPIICYHFFFESFMGGRTPGKLIAGTRVTLLDGSSPGPIAYFLRWVLLPIDLFPTGIGVGGLFIIFSQRHQRIGDFAAGTVIVRNAKPPKLDLDKDFIEFSEDYKPTFSQVELLSDGQVRFISYMLYDPRNKRAITASIQSLSFKVKEILKTESPLDDYSFLETVVRDYNYYAWQSISM